LLCLHARRPTGSGRAGERLSRYISFTVVDGNSITFDYTVQLAGIANPVSQSKSITREIVTTPGTTCR